MDIPYFVVHAFSSRALEGSPAVVGLLEEALPDTVLMAIAAEGAGVETTFLRRTDRGYEIRWLTATRELPLCTHATLAAGAVVLRHLFPSETRVTFLAESGPLEVAKRGEQFAMELPRLMPTRVDDIPLLLRGVPAPTFESTPIIAGRVNAFEGFAVLELPDGSDVYTPVTRSRSKVAVEQAHANDLLGHEVVRALLRRAPDDVPLENARPLLVDLQQAGRIEDFDLNLSRVASPSHPRFEGRGWWIGNDGVRHVTNAIEAPSKQATEALVAQAILDALRALP